MSLGLPLPFLSFRLRASPIAFSLAAASLAGCASTPLSAPRTAVPERFEAAAAADPALQPTALDRWWTLFGDAQLTALVDEALASAPTARQALQRLEEARALRAQTLSAYLPQGNIQGSAQTQHTDQSYGGFGVATGGAGTTTGAGTTGTGATGASGVGSGFLTPSGQLNTYAAQFDVSYQLDVFGRRRTAASAANADVAAARFDAEATRAVLARDVATGLFQARGYAIQAADARETARITGDLAKSSLLSADRGLTSTSDAARLQVDAATAEAEVARLDAAKTGARRSLLALLGRSGASSSSLAIEPTAASPPSPPEVTPGELLRRRPDVRRDEMRLRSATDTLKLDRLALFPTFSLTPGGSYSKTTGSYASTTSLWSVGLNAVLPVLDRPRLLATIRGQRARGEEAVNAYEITVQNAYRDAETGLSTLAGDRVRVARLQEATDRARFAFDAKRKGYDLGLSDLTTLLDAERSWRTTRATLTAAQITALVDAATVFQALGGGWSPVDVKEARR